ncbi:MAG: GNAT family N-acetyltransferase [Anaerolineae bacterium]|nr:GNAT family N-acetyltransferase [Anaerolineae bacterium]
MALEGKIVRLREEREADLQFLIDLRNDMDTQGWSQRLPPDYTLDMYEKRHRERDFTMERKDGRFTIVDKESGELIGTIGYAELEPRLSATVGIAITKKYWGSGAAMDAIETLLQFLYQGLGLQVVRLWTHSGNERAVGSAEKIGFKVALRQREGIFYDGRLYDNLVMDMTREEYFERHPDLEDGLPSMEIDR